MTVAVPATAAESQRRSNPPQSSTDDDALTIAVTPALEPADEALTVAVAPPSESAADALTIAPSSGAPSLGGAATIAPTATTRVRKKRKGRSADRGPLEVGQSFGPRYHIIRLLGAGGMGAVYQAWDAELGVAVAIKVIRPEVMADPATADEVGRRFKRELLLARQVTHKNVVRIHDLGDIDGIKYITMSYIEGTDLATILKREGKPPIGDTLRMARSVVSGLVAAHAAGVVHRDLKPANIMISKDGEALIMDFGIAHSTGDVAASAIGSGSIPDSMRRAAEHTASTTLGAIVGTLEYMAPEQARGQAVDQRADIYSFGLILYDVLMGRRRAASGESAVAELQRRMTTPPPPLAAIGPDVPPAVAALVARCVEPEAEKRFQSTGELEAELAKLDDEGKVIPIARRVTRRLVVAASLLVLVLLATTFYITRKAVAPPKTHDPVTVLVADFENRTGEPEFNHAIEPTVSRALSEASFITSYDRTRVRANFSVQPPEKLDEASATKLAANLGLGVVLSGSIERRGGGYEVAVKAAQPLTGTVLLSDSRRAANKDQVVEVATRLVTEVRKALGDEQSESDQMFAMRSTSATSLEVVRLYAAGFEAASDAKWDDAETHFLDAVNKDPKSSGFGYQALSAIARNRGKLADAEKYMKQALSQLGGMTERERLATRGSYFSMIGDYEQCVKTYGELLNRYAADVASRNQRALCLSKKREMRAAVDEMQEAVRILPNRVVYRGNLAVYADYASDFTTALKEAQAIKEPYDLGTLAIAFSQLGQGQDAEAAETYRSLAKISTRGGTWGASGLADLALYEGRFSDAVRLFEEGAAADLKAKNPDRAARKLTSSAYAQLLRGQNTAAIAAADKATMLSNAVGVRFLAARTYVEAGAFTKAQKIADDLLKELAPERQAHGKIIAGEIALKKKDAREAVRLFTDANMNLDTWIGHFDLGRAYLELGETAMPQADMEFDLCIQRRGQALALMVDEEPTYGYFPIAYYYQGRVRQALNAAFAEPYGKYLEIRGNSKEDRLVSEVRRIVK